MICRQGLLFFDDMNKYSENKNKKFKRRNLDFLEAVNERWVGAA